MELTEIGHNYAYYGTFYKLGYGCLLPKILVDGIRQNQHINYLELLIYWLKPKLHSQN